MFGAAQSVFFLCVFLVDSLIFFWAFWKASVGVWGGVAPGVGGVL